MNTRERAVVDAFHDLYYNGLPGEGPIFQRTYWMGVPCLKCPLDMWVYQEIINEVRPDLIIETGTHWGGSALFMAHVLDLVGKGRVISIDIEELPRVRHPRVEYVKGSSADESLLRSRVNLRRGEKCMVVLDSDHTKSHVLRELQLLAPYVSVGGYLIVEDTNINGHPTFPSFGEGPREATEEFLRAAPHFVVDEAREKFLMTFNPRGYLRRVS